MMKRRRFKQQITLEDRLVAWARQIRARAARFPARPDREAVLKKTSQADVASHLNDWVNSAELQPPK